MNESETRAELIDPKLKEAGWGIVEGSKVLREYHITAGKIQVGGRGKKQIADYVLVYKGTKLAIIEAKSADLSVGEGVMQAKQYAEKLKLATTYSTNGNHIYQICMESGLEGLVDDFLSPDQLWEKTFSASNQTDEDKPTSYVDDWRERFASVPFEDKSGTWELRYYQEIAVAKTLETIAKQKDRALLTLATGTGKTAISFQIAWKLFQTRWNLNDRAKHPDDASRRPRILFLADRNILANQAFNSFSAFPDDALVRIKPSEIKKSGKVPTNGSLFFTIFQTFMSGTDEHGKPAPYFGEYPKDYFDLIIIDECHRGGANDESNWRAILEYFAPAVQLGLTATPKRNDNVDTYRYFGEPIYIYSLKEGINDGFLTPFKVKRVQTTLDDYIYTSDDEVLEGEIEDGKRYEEKDFNRTIEIEERERKRVQIYLADCNQKEKAIVFCANQAHAALVRDLINQESKSKDPFYCVRVTANDGAEGESQLKKFQDNENSIPTILTTSQKLSTGVDARNVRNIVLMRPVNSMIEFKQIVGRGTRVFDGKEFFTIYDYVDANHHFADPEWDGEPAEPEEVIGEVVALTPCKECGEMICVCVKEPSAPCLVCGESPCRCEKKSNKVKVKLARGKERVIQHMMSTSFWSADGKPISSEEFMAELFGELPKLFKDEEELRAIWGNPVTRRTFLESLDEMGFPKSDLLTLQKLVNMEKSDLFDVLEYVFNGDFIAKSREERAQLAKQSVIPLLNTNQREFIDFVLEKYVEVGIEELDDSKLKSLIENKYQSLPDGLSQLGSAGEVRRMFIEFQQYLYQDVVA
ncbi:EcoAI/FtnUII family type I restriction enzme subunit R [Algoriphagus persicinus]|uniref:EcoAI/FtnUII family type I restriction enzme subunit R n=1 Tax=Algoriphagus persicinus TaxID=3108754 RepID=UPI002B3EC3E2|nr:DEAD/DEAH box helicase family protein [Algoriphagus sp. E1-3-M2]MEB2785568.1 DEAD/DEAH box helicase family protein [Algoriphagus sp. E1-3-M2]